MDNEDYAEIGEFVIERFSDTKKVHPCMPYVIPILLPPVKAAKPGSDKQSCPHCPLIYRVTLEETKKLRAIIGGTPAVYNFVCNCSGYLKEPAPKKFRAIRFASAQK